MSEKAMLVGETADLPRVIPLFPLPNVVLFPGVLLPLHIFEERYRQMIRDLEGASDPLIGMVLLRGEWEKDYSGCPEIFPTGCAGRVIDLVRLPDGRFNIVLSGVREFTVLGEHRGRAYRQAAVQWRRESAQHLPEPERRSLLSAGLALLKRMGQRPAWVSHLHDLSDVHLVNVLSFALPLHVLEKQALLEAPCLVQRALRLREAMEFERYDLARERDDSGGRDRH